MLCASGALTLANNQHQAIVEGGSRSANHGGVDQAGDGGGQGTVHAGDDDDDIRCPHCRQVLHDAGQPRVDAQILQQCEAIG